MQLASSVELKRISRVCFLIVPFIVYWLFDTQMNVAHSEHGAEFVCLMHVNDAGGCATSFGTRAGVAFLSSTVGLDEQFAIYLATARNVEG